MPDVIPFPTAPRSTAPADRWHEVATCGEVGILSVALMRRPDTAPGRLHVVVVGPPAVGIEIVATVPDDEAGRAGADFAGAAIVRALEVAETAFTFRPRAS